MNCLPEKLAQYTPVIFWKVHNQKNMKKMKTISSPVNETAIACFGEE